MDVSSLDLLALAKSWALPPGILVFTGLLGVLLWRRPIGRLLALLSALALWGLSMPQTSAWLAAALETDPPLTEKALLASDAQAILVLTAGRDYRAPELGGKDGLSNLSLARLHHAVRLHRQSKLPIVLAGGTPLKHEQAPLAELAAKELEQQYDIRPLIIEAGSRTTWENLQFSKVLLDQAGIRSVLLVTHAWHMPRARLSAERAGVNMLPAPMGYLSDSDDESVWSDWMPSAGALAANRFLLHEYLGLLRYRFK